MLSLFFRLLAALGFTETTFTGLLSVAREVLLDELDLFTTVLLILILGIFGRLLLGFGLLLGAGALVAKMILGDGEGTGGAGGGLLVAGMILAGFCRATL